MNKLKLSFLIIATFILTVSVHAAKEEYSRKVSKSFDINSDATLNISNKFGTIHCENWDKNVIAIEVTISLEASSQEKADKYFDRIEITLSGNKDMVSGKTSMEDNLFKNNNGELSIDYMINMPKSVNIDLTNRFGDIFIDEVAGSSKIDLGYGEIKAKRLTNHNNEIDIKFSEGFIGYVQQAELILQYSELEISEAGKLNADVKFSEMALGIVDVMTLETGYDDISVGKVRDIDIDANFSDVEIRSLNERLTVHADYGELSVKEISSKFKLIDIENSFAEATLGFDSQANFRMTATIKMGDFSYPENLAKLSVIDLSMTANKYEGLIGSDKDTESKVIISSKHSDVTLYYR
jgi:hypothetical protein